MKKYVLISAAVVVTLSAALSLVVSVCKQQTRISFVVNAMQGQPYGKSLGQGSVGSRECYSNGSARQCPAITYDIDRSTCVVVAQSYPSELTADDCGPAYGTVEYQNRTIKLYVGQGSEADTYWVQAWLEE